MGSREEPQDPDVVVVGGGLAGLSAALSLVRHLGDSSKILVLEATDRWGGAVHTVHQPTTGLRWEAGAGRIAAHHRHMHALLRRYRLSTAPIQGARKLAFRTDTVHSTGPTLEEYVSACLRAARDTDRRVLMRESFSTFATRVLGAMDARRFQVLFAYDSDFTRARAEETLHALRDTMRPDISFSFCTEGLDALVQAMVRELQEKRVVMRLGCRVEAVLSTARSRFTIVTPTAKIRTRGVVLALPPVALQAVVPSLAPLFQKHLEAVSLVRIYARFRRPWTLPRVVTDLPVRQVIPVRPAQGLVMVAYADTEHAAFWTRFGDDRTQSRLQQEIMRQLRSIYGDAAMDAIGNPAELHMHAWNQGVHVWKGTWTGARFRREVRSVLPPAMAIAAEAYADRHAWMEGAVASGYEASRTVLKAIIENGSD